MLNLEGLYLRLYLQKFNYKTRVDSRMSKPSNVLPIGHVMDWSFRANVRFQYINTYKGSRNKLFRRWIILIEIVIC